MLPLCIISGLVQQFFGAVCGAWQNEVAADFREDFVGSQQLLLSSHVWARGGAGRTGLFLEAEHLGSKYVADIVRDMSVIVLHTFTFDLFVICCTGLLSLAQRLTLHALLLCLAGRTFFLNLDLVAACSFRESPCHDNFLISDREEGWRGYPVMLLTTVVFGLRVV